MSNDAKLKLETDPQGLVKKAIENLDRPPDLHVTVQDHDGLSFLTPHSITHLQNRLSEFDTQVLKEARSIEKAEHVGSGPPEITAAHIDEAWWVSRRRIRRSKHPVLIPCMRIAETLGSAGVGIGATYVTKSWGVGVFIFCTVGTMGAFLLEAYLARKD